VLCVLASITLSSDYAAIYGRRSGESKPRFGRFS
jgi:hypothetical protein